MLKNFSFNAQLKKFKMCIPIFYFGLISLQGQNLGIYSSVHIDSGASIALHNAVIHFNDGIVQTTSVQPGRVALYGETSYFNVSDNSHIAAPVRSTASIHFIFPVGDSGIYQPLGIENGDGLPLTVQFRFSAPPFAKLPTAIEQLSPNFYWSVEGNDLAQVQLSWTTFSQLSAWVEDLSTLRILGYTGTSWEDIPAQLAPFALSNNNPTSLNQGSISSVNPIDFTAYSALTIGAVSFNTTLNISQAITPNGDGINDVWFIENIERYPDARITVFNRWGARVFFQANNYQNDWGGNFENNSTPLPSAPYFYRIDIDNDGEIDHEGWIYINH